jgi:hypothetical protein
MPDSTANAVVHPMSLLREPDLVIALDADDRTADAARFCVGTIARPAPAARDRAEHLTAALLARSSSRRRSPIDLRVWGGGETTRVELDAPAELLLTGLDERAADDAADLLDRLADRWGLEQAGAEVRVWFEVDGGDADEPFAQRLDDPAPLAA